MPDLAVLDDPEPPQFGAMRAEEAVRRSAQHQAHRARFIALAVLAVVAVAGLGLAGTRNDRPAARLDTALPPSAEPEVTTPVDVPPSLPPGQLEPAATAPPAPTATVPAPVASATTLAPGITPPITAAPSGPGGGAPGMVPTTVPAPTRATARPPEGTVPAPAGLRLTLTLEAAQVPSGGQVRGVARFENNRTTTVTIAQPSCGPVLGAGLYDAGRSTGASTCEGIPSIVVPPGTAQQVDVEVFAHPTLRAGTYGAFATTRLEEDGVTIHSAGVVVTVVRP